MRSSTIFALAAASSTLAFAEKSDSFDSIKPIVDTESVDATTGFKASFSTKGNVGTSLLPNEKDSTVVIPVAKEETPSLTARQATQQVYGQCGGGKYAGPTTCASGSQCYKRDASYSQCLPTVQQAYGQCAGKSYFGTNVCVPGSSCKKLRSDYSQCIPNGRSAVAKLVASPQEGTQGDAVLDAADMDLKHTVQGSQDEDPVHASMSSAAGYKSEEAPTYASEATPKLVTQDTMMAMPTGETSAISNTTTAAVMKTSGVLVAPSPSSSSSPSSMMMMMPTAYVAKTSSMYGMHNATKTAAEAPVPSGTTTSDSTPKVFEGGAAKGLVVSGALGGFAVLAVLVL